MSTLDLSQDSRRKPGELVTDIDLSDEAVALLPEARNAYGYLATLIENELFSDAFLTLARILPKQYAIIWAVKCVEGIPVSEMSDLDQRCMAVAKQWLQGPDERLRRAAMNSAEALEFETPHAWLAAAVAFSGGSLAPEGQTEVPPPEHLTAVAVSACLTAVAVRDPDTYNETSRRMINNGLAMVAIPGSAGGR